MQYIDETLLELKKARERLDSIVVGYSGGKDSLVVMDLCVRTFPKVEAFIMEFVPGLSLVEESIAFARARWGIECRRYLHWSAIAAMREGSFCDTHWTKDIPKTTIGQIHMMVRRDTGIALIATGAKRSDSMGRRMLMAFTKNDELITPIAGWTKDHVVGYLKIQGIPLPDTSGDAMSGIDLRVSSLCWLHDKHPEDFKKLCRIFPYAPAVIWRRQFYPELAHTKGQRGKRDSKEAA